VKHAVRTADESGIARDHSSAPPAAKRSLTIGARHHDRLDDLAGLPLLHQRAPKAARPLLSVVALLPHRAARKQAAEQRCLTRLQ